MNSCIFCRIIAHQLPATIVYENDHVIVINDIHPKAPVHYLIIPKKHTDTLVDITDADAAHAAGVIFAARDIIKQKKLKAARLIVNSGADAGQTVFHTHVHLLAGKVMHDF